MTPAANDSSGPRSMFDKALSVGYTYRLLVADRGISLPGPQLGKQRGSMASKAKVLTEAEIVKMPKSEYMNAAQLRFFRERLLALQKELRDNAGATTEHLRELSFAPDPGRPRHHRGGARARAAHARPRAQAAQEDRPGARAHRRRQLRLLRGDRRAHRHPAPARAPHRHAHDRGAGASRAQAEALRRIAAFRRHRPAAAVASPQICPSIPRGIRRGRPPCGSYNCAMPRHTVTPRIP